MNRYFKGIWISDDKNNPVLMFYEVNSNDQVSRTIEVFSNGSRIKDSVEWHSPDNLKGIGSLVERGFIHSLPSKFEAGLSCEEIDRSAFEKEWSE